MKTISSFFQIALAITTLSFLPICISASEFRKEYFIVMVVLLFLTIIGMTWWKRTIKRNPKKLLNQLN